jgi:hypothetical protein
MQARHRHTAAKWSKAIHARPSLMPTGRAPPAPGRLGPASGHRARLGERHRLLDAQDQVLLPGPLGGCLGEVGAGVGQWISLEHFAGATGSSRNPPAGNPRRRPAGWPPRGASPWPTERSGPVHEGQGDLVGLSASRNSRGLPGGGTGAIPPVTGRPWTATVPGCGSPQTGVRLPLALGAWRMRWFNWKPVLYKLRADGSGDGDPFNGRLAPGVRTHT